MLSPQRWIFKSNHSRFLSLKAKPSNWNFVLRLGYSVKEVYDSTPRRHLIQEQENVMKNFHGNLKRLKRLLLSVVKATAINLFFLSLTSSQNNKRLSSTYFRTWQFSARLRFEFLEKVPRSNEDGKLMKVHIEPFNLNKSQRSLVSRLRHFSSIVKAKRWQEIRDLLMSPS